MAFRILLVGLGNRGRQWADIIRDHADVALAAVADTDPARIAAFDAHQPGVPGFPSLEAALAGTKPDAVLLVTPPVGRLAQARAVFAAGLPLLAEKPLAVDLAEAAAIVRLAEHHGLPLTIGL